MQLLTFHCVSVSNIILNCLSILCSIFLSWVNVCKMSRRVVCTCKAPYRNVTQTATVDCLQSRTFIWGCQSRKLDEAPSFYNGLEQLLHCQIREQLGNIITRRNYLITIGEICLFVLLGKDWLSLLVCSHMCFFQFRLCFFK